MFSAGTRVYTCSSSIIGKKLGPKRHSLGYISSSGAAHFVNYVRDFPIKEQSFVLFPLEIVFTKYGKEEKQRCETRGFLQILPVFTTSVYEESVTIKKIQEIIGILNRGELSKNSHWYNIASNYVNNPLNMGTVIPVGHTSASRMSDNEALAWVTSILRNPNFRHLIRTHRHLPTLKAVVTDDFLTWFSNAVTSSHIRKDLLRWANEETPHMEALLESIQCINTIFCRGMHNDSCGITATKIKKGKIKNINLFSSWLLADLFQDENIIKGKENIVYGSPIDSNSKLTNLTKCMRSVRATYLTIKPKYI